MLEAIKKRITAMKQFERLNQAYKTGNLSFISASKGRDQGVDRYNAIKLAQDVQKRGGTVLKGIGLTKEYGNEKSFAVVGLSKDNLIDLAKKYNQAEVIHGNERLDSYGNKIGIFKPEKTEIVYGQIKHIKQKQKKGTIEDQTYLRNSRTRIKLKT